MARTTERTDMRAVAQAISAVAAGTARSQGISVQVERQRRQERHRFDAETLQPARAQNSSGGEQRARAAPRQRPRRNNAIPRRAR